MRMQLNLPRYQHLGYFCTSHKRRWKFGLRAQRTNRAPEECTVNPETVFWMRLCWEVRLSFCPWMSCTHRWVSLSRTNGLHRGWRNSFSVRDCLLSTWKWLLRVTRTHTGSPSQVNPKYFLLSFWPTTCSPYKCSLVRLWMLRLVREGGFLVASSRPSLHRAMHGNMNFVRPKRFCALAILHLRR